MSTSSVSGSHRRLILLDGVVMTTSAMLPRHTLSSKQVILLTRVMDGSFMVSPNALHQARRPPEPRTRLRRNPASPECSGLASWQCVPRITARRRLVRAPNRVRAAPRADGQWGVGSSQRQVRVDILPGWDVASALMLIERPHLFSRVDLPQVVYAARSLYRRG
jgi:hypothetical protein